MPQALFFPNSAPLFPNSGEGGTPASKSPGHVGTLPSL